jgi:hypothetical protein
MKTSSEAAEDHNHPSAFRHEELEEGDQGSRLPHLHQLWNKLEVGCGILPIALTAESAASFFKGEGPPT